MPFFSIGTTVQVGAESVSIAFDDPLKTAKVASELRKMSRRVTPDAVFQHRKTSAGRKEYEYLEFYSPSLKAKKQTSKGDPADVEEFPYFISHSAPWIKVIAKDKAKKCGYAFAIMFDWPETASEHGLQPNVWYAAEYMDHDAGDYRRGSFRPLDPSKPLVAAEPYHLGSMRTPIQKIIERRGS